MCTSQVAQQWELVSVIQMKEIYLVCIEQKLLSSSWLLFVASLFDCDVTPWALLSWQSLNTMWVWSILYSASKIKVHTCSFLLIFATCMHLHLPSQSICTCWSSPMWQAKVVRQITSYMYQRDMGVSQWWKGDKWANKIQLLHRLHCIINYMHCTMSCRFSSTFGDGV